MALTKVTGQVINNTTGLVVGVTTVGGGVSATDGFFSGIVTFSNSVSVAGTLTYEDVTNIDAVGLVTARNGIVVGSGITLSKDGDGFFTGVVTATSYAGDGSGLTGIAATDNVRTGILDVAGIATFRADAIFNADVRVTDSIIHEGDTNTKIRFPSADTITAETGGSERVRIDSSGRLGIGTASGTRGLNVEGTGSAARAFFNDSSNHKAVEFGADGTGSFQSTIGNNPHLIYINGSEQLRINSSGHLLLGTTTAAVTAGKALMIAATDGARIKLCDS